ncbi:hypothetical protein BsWGS_14933 [Bradybaena similaris]
MTIEKIRGGGEQFKYAYTIYSKLQQFPYKFYWKHARLFRFSCYTAPFVLLCFSYLGKLTQSPDNVKKWDEIRAKRHHTFFELPHD